MWHLPYALFVKIKMITGREVERQLHVASEGWTGIDSAAVKNRFQPSGSPRLIDAGRHGSLKFSMNINFWHLRYRSDAVSLLIVLCAWGWAIYDSPSVEVVRNK